ncbi:hypothetical protein CYMTET_8112 [Cymbomonas tetramitiformis]|uniref:Uncharacterized protein n=1 Tax=Cymbomonas tetramitiformis TaxID=36881 RepID=A0AAE0GVJ8_9CHLO|nr:hypothetical protein CYMTET_8112 [Cymbomonas tetramitiformis]
MLRVFQTPRMNPKLRSVELEAKNVELLKTQRQLRQALDITKNKVASAKTSQARAELALGSAGRKVDKASKERNVANVELSTAHSKLFSLKQATRQLEAEIKQISVERDNAVESLVVAHNEFREIIGQDFGDDSVEDRASGDALSLLDPTIEVVDGHLRYKTEKIVEYQRIVHEFRLKGGRVSQLFHRVLHLFTNIDIETLQRRAPLPKTSQQYEHTQWMGLAKAHTLSIARSEARPFYANECDEVAITRSKFMINFVMFKHPEQQSATRLMAGAVRIANTTGASEFGGVHRSLQNISWSVVHWLWWTSDSASSMLTAVDLARGAKLRAYNHMLGTPQRPTGYFLAAYLPRDIQFYFMVHSSAPNMVIPLGGPYYIPDECHIWKNGEAKLIAEFGSGVNMGSTKLVYNWLKGELFRLARLSKPSHEFRDLLWDLHPEVAEKYGTMPAEIKHRFNIMTKIARA